MQVRESAYDALAPRFERERAVPDGVAQAVRDLVLEAAGVARPRVLDLGAGTGRIGWPFVAAGDDYVGVDLSFGMLRAFIERCESAPRLVQADGLRLPFADAMFDLVMLIQVFGGLNDPRQFVDEVRRVLRPAGVVVIGRTAAPEDGVDARMKRQLDSILGKAGAKRQNARAALEDRVGARATGIERRSAGTWTAQRTPRQFIARHRDGARFSTLPETVKNDAMTRLAAWAESEFGSLDAASSEAHAFELTIFKFEGATA